MFFAVVIAPVLVATGCGSHVEHVVRKGDTLYSISFRYEQDYRDIARWNGIDPPYVLTPGQHLRVAPPRAPSHAERMAALRRPADPASAPSPAQSTVRPAVTPAEAADRRVARVEAPGTARTMPAQPARSAPPPAAPPAALAPVSAWRWPVSDAPVRKDAEVRRVRKGLDIVGRRGEPVQAAADGRVVYSGAGIPHYGNLIIIKHDERFLTAYAHNERLLVGEGDVVRAGQAIAEMGDSGTGTQSVKLHFEIRLDGEPVDPMKYLGGA